MIILDITDESGVSFYEILEFKPDLLTGLDEKQAAKKIRDAANKARKPYSKAAQRGDKEAEERLARVNEAETALKKADDRSRYDEQFQNSSGSALFRLQPIAPLFFRDRTARFGAIERTLREQRPDDAQLHHVWQEQLHTHRVRALPHLQMLNLSIQELAGLDENEAATKIRDAVIKAREKYTRAALHGDKEAWECLARMHESEPCLRGYLRLLQVPEPSAAGAAHVPAP